MLSFSMQHRALALQSIVTPAKLASERFKRGAGVRKVSKIPGIQVEDAAPAAPRRNDVYRNFLRTKAPRLFLDDF